MPKGTISVTVQCRNCGSAVIDFPDEEPDDPIAKCGQCGNVLGPISSINAKVRGEGHTPVNIDIIIGRKIID